MLGPALVDYSDAPFNGPFSQYASLLSGSPTAPFEGLWVPARYAKSSCVLLTGGFSAISAELWVANDFQMPANQVTVTVGGAATSTDSVGLKFASPLLPNGSKTPAYVVQPADTLALVAAGLSAAIAADTDLAALGITAKATNTAVLIQWPSTPPGSTPGSFGSPSQPREANTLVLSSVLSGGATETLTQANGTNGFKNATLTAAGLTAIASPIRWIKARLASITGSPVTIDFAGAG